MSSSRSKIQNDRFLKMKIKLDSTTGISISNFDIIFASDDLELASTYNSKRFTRGNRTDQDGYLSNKKKSILTLRSIFQGSCYVNRRRDGVKRAAKSQVARGISASKQVARNEETSFREFEPMEK